MINIWILEIKCVNLFTNQRLGDLKTTRPTVLIFLHKREHWNCITSSFRLPIGTRLRSSRMHTTRLLPVSPSMHCSGGFLVQGSTWSKGGACSQRGACSQSNLVLGGGACSQGMPGPRGEFGHGGVPGPRGGSCLRSGFTITETRCESCHRHVQLVYEHLQKATGSRK